MLAICIAAGMAAFSLTTLRLLSKRKRPKGDPTTWFWQLGLASLLLCSGIWMVGALVPRIAGEPYYSLTLGVLFFIGFAYSIVNGMLYKIVPFLLWFHLQKNVEAGRHRGVKLKEIISDRTARGQFHVHTVALSMLIAAIFLPSAFSRLAGAMFTASSLWLWINLAGAAWTYASMPCCGVNGRLQAS